MKITKSQLKRIIKEELKIAIKENDDWYDDEKGYETVADRKWADQQAQRPYRTGVPDEDLKNADDFEKYPKTSAEAEGERIADELNQEWLAQPGNTEKPLNLVDDDIFTIAMAVREGVLDMEDAKQAVRGDLQALYAAADEANKHLTNKLNDLIGLPEGKAGEYGKGKGVPKDATKAEQKEQERRERHRAKQNLKDLKKQELEEGRPDKRQPKSTREWGKEERKKEGGKYRAASKKETEELKKLRRGGEELKKLRRGGEELDEIIREMIDEVADEELSEKCKESGCATPEEVAEYGDAIDKGAKNRKKIKNPYALAWWVAKQPGSIKGPKIAGRVPGYKKGK